MSSTDSELRQYLYDLEVEFLHGIPVYLPRKVVDEIMLKVAAEKQRWEIEARLGMVEYFDQCPANDLMDWKGLFADTRGLLKDELAALDGVIEKKK